MAGEFDYIGKHAFSINGFKMKGLIPPSPTFDRIVRFEGNPPEHHPREQDYFVTEVDEVEPLGVVVCTHEASNPTEVLDVLERHAIEERNNQLCKKSRECDETPSETLYKLCTTLFQRF